MRGTRGKGFDEPGWSQYAIELRGRPDSSVTGRPGASCRWDGAAPVVLAVGAADIPRGHHRLVVVSPSSG
ncbi:hypothetical protein, partial [Streptomyces violascens]|uniref:hypothetical protein n=1 Tax=Streptomyces violascens TaxID=67381 RepID=UPI0036C34E96